MERRRISGVGVATYANGDVYEGMFSNGKRQGEGTMRYATGKKVQGEWQDGELARNDADIGAASGD